MALDFARARKDGPRRRTGRRRRRNGRGIRGFDALEARLLLSLGDDLLEVEGPPPLLETLEPGVEPQELPELTVEGPPPLRATLEPISTSISPSPTPPSDPPVEGQFDPALAEGPLGPVASLARATMLDEAENPPIATTNLDAPTPDTSPWIIEAVPAPDDPNAAPQLFEMIGAHDQPENAQELPNLDRFQVFGELAEGERYDMYRVNLADGVRSVQVDFRLRSPAFDRGERIVLLDENGNLLDDRPFDLSTGSVDLVLRATVPGSSQAVYVGIYRPDAFAPPPGSVPTPVALTDDMTLDGDGTGQIPTPFPPTPGSKGSSTAYSIQISQTYDSPSTPTLPSTPTTGEDRNPPTTPTESSSTPTEGEARPEHQAASVPSGSTASGVTVVIRVIAGPSIDPAPRPARPSGLRSSAPAGGRLALGPPTRIVNRRDAAILDLNLVARTDLDSTGGELENAPAGPIERGALYDGLRFFGADPLALVGSSRGHSRRLVRSSALALGVLDVATTEAPAPATAAVPSAASPRRAAISGAVRAGLGLAYALTFTLLLPDLTDALRQAEERPRRRLRLAYLRRLLDLRRPSAAPQLRHRGQAASRGR